MFVTNKLIPLPVLAQLRLTTTPFYLTGSRRFGGGDDTSDWDFFTPESPQIRFSLSTWGFKRLCPDFGYPSDVEVWRHAAEHIDVQIRKNADEFEEACQLIEITGTVPPKNPDARRAFWLNIVSAIRRAHRQSVA